MRTGLFLALLLLASCALCAQTTPAKSTSVQPAAANSVASTRPATFTSDAGFSYSYPADWDVVDAKPMLPAVQMQANDTADNAVEKRGVNCTQVGLLLKHKSLQSSIIVLVLPYSCIGAPLKETDLAGVASGMAEGIKKNYEIKDPAYAAYRLGKFGFSAERSQASSKAHPEVTVTLETTCGLLSKAMVCWMAFAGKPEAISVLEAGKTSLEGASELPLVPSATFTRNRD
jgi:hypothetical protein